MKNGFTGINGRDFSGAMLHGNKGDSEHTEDVFVTPNIGERFDTSFDNCSGANECQLGSG